MFQFLCKALLLSRNGCTLTAQNPSVVVSSSLRYLSCKADQHSFTLSYLINTCGLPSESALSASKSVHFKTPEKPDLIISFFQRLGFSRNQIAEIIIKHPKTLSLNLEKIIVPKVEFFRSKGASTQDIIRIFTFYPWILHRSLENHMIPTFNFYRELLKSEETAIAAFIHYPGILASCLEANVIPNINTLRRNKVPAEKVLFLVHNHAGSIGKPSGQFGKVVREVREMGIDPLRITFVLAVVALTRLSKPMRSQRIDIYKRWGWSDEDFIIAFKRYPFCMAISNDKIMAVMDFYVNKMGLDSSVMANRPVLLSLSLKKRLIPRAAVIQYLSSRGLVKLDSNKTSLFESTEKCFLQKFVNCYEEAPHLLKIYNEKLGPLQRQGDKKKAKRNL